MNRLSATTALAALALVAACAGDTTAPTAPQFAPLASAFDVGSHLGAGNIVVKPSSMHGWYFWNDYDDTFTGSPGALVVGPANPPLGIGSVRLGPLTTAGGATGQSVIATNEFSGTKLTDITDLAYSTFQTGPTLAIALQFDVRYRTTDAAYGGRLVFEPYQNGTVAVGSGWQSWSPLKGKWWATKTTLAGTDGLCAQSTPCTWANITTAFPNAIISGRFLLKAGSNWAGFDGNADALTVAIRRNAETFDFEPDRGRAAASNFAVLANQAVTCTDGSIIGDVGTFQAKPTGSVTLTSCPVTGTVHVGDGVAKQAFNAFVAAYDALAPQVGQCDPTHTLTGTLAGITLTPGTYCFDAAATLTGTLTLNGGGAYTFLVSGALTGTSFNVVLANGAQACDVTWLTTAGATMTDSRFIGTILAAGAITLTRGTFDGNAWAGASGVGDVTITGTAVTGCAGTKGKHHKGKKDKCNQGVGNGSEGCDPGDSNHHNSSNDEHGGTPGNPGRKGGSN